MRTRWRNHKAQIKKGIKSCEISTHFANNMQTMHKLDTSNQNVFTRQLGEQLNVQLIESVEFDPKVDMVAKMEARETYWQGALKATKLFGGLNKRKNKKRA